MASGSFDATVLIWDLSKFSIDFSPNKLTADQENSLWADLKNTDATQAYQAMRKLVAAGGQAVGLIKKQLRPEMAVREQELSRLLSELDSPRFAVRKVAAQELEHLGLQAEVGLRKVLASKPPLELRRRVEMLLGKLRREPFGPSPQERLQSRALRVLELINTPEARQTLNAIAKGARLY